MNRRHSTSDAVRYALMMGVAAMAAGSASTASAASANQKAVKLQKVTVTGTHIKRANIETAQPITRISSQQIEKSGYTDLSTLLGQLSFAGRHASNVGGGNGYQTVNLRGIGANRTLILVNGKRYVPTLGGTTSLSSLPTSIIDHIEILQDGASAIYGSDAIGGVVNVITKKNFKGAQAHAYYGIHNDPDTGHWDGQVRQYDLTVGDGNKRGNVVLNLSYRKQNEIKRMARKITRTPVVGQPAYFRASGATPAGHFRLFGPAVSGRTFGKATCGAYDPTTPTATLCNLTLQNVPAQPATQNFRGFKNTDNYNGGPESSLLTPSKRVSVYSQGHYDLLKNVTVSANVAYARTEATPYGAPNVIQIGADSAKTANGQKIGVGASNPYNPFDLALVPSRTAPCVKAGTCIGLGRITRRMIESGRSFQHYSYRTLHVFAGFNGFVNLFNREIDWDVGFAQNNLLNRNTVPEYNLAYVADALGSTSPCTGSCVPLNLFGGSVAGEGGSISPKQLNYISYTRHVVHHSDLRDWTADISSDVYDLPAGPLGVAIGWERIDNYGNRENSPVQAHGNDSGFNTTNQHGRIIRQAEYAELNIPLLADLPGAKSLSVDIANRWTQVKRMGGRNDVTAFDHNTSGRLNIRYQPINDLLLRATWSQGFKSPTIPQLFAGQVVHETAFTDPCVPVPLGSYSGGPLPPNCPNGTQDRYFSLSQNVTGSNPQLGPEKSISRTAGFVYSPSQVPGLDVSAGYFKIEIDNNIGAVGAGNILNGCFFNGNFCNLVTVTNNQITRLVDSSTNVGSLLTEGVDVGLHYKFPSTPFGDFSVRVHGSILNNLDRTVVNRGGGKGAASFVTSKLAGTGGHAKERFNGYLNWDYGNWSAQYRLQYIGDTVGRCGIGLQGFCTYPNRTTNFQGKPGLFPLGRQHLGATVYHDVHLAYRVPSVNTTFAVGVNNLFGKKPPISGGGGYGFSYYRLPSRFLYGSIRVNF